MQLNYVKKVFAVVLSTSLILQIGVPTVYANEISFTQETNAGTAFSGVEQTTGAAISLGQSVSEQLENLSVGDPFTINGVEALYKGDVSNSSIVVTRGDYKTDGASTIYKAGNGYALLTWPRSNREPYSLILHEVAISTSTSGSNTAISVFGPLDVTLEGENVIKASHSGIESSNSNPRISIGGNGSLDIEAYMYALNARYHGDEATDTLIIKGNVRLNLKAKQCIGSGKIITKDNSQTTLVAKNEWDDFATYVQRISVEDRSQLKAEGENPIGVVTKGVNVGENATLNIISRGVLSRDSWPHCIYGTITVLEDKTLDLSKTIPLTTGEKAAIVNHGTLVLKSDYSADKIAEFNISNHGTMKLGEKAVVLVNGKLYADGGKVTGDFDLSSNTVVEATCYKKGEGYLLFEPESVNAPAMLTLHNVDLEHSITLPHNLATLSLEGTNKVKMINASGSFTATGSGSLDSGMLCNSDASGEISLDVGATLNTQYQTTKNSITTNTIYGNYTVSDYDGISVGPDNKLVLTPGAVLTLSEQGHLLFEENGAINDMTIGAGAAVVNKTYVTLPKGITMEQIKILPFSGIGLMRIATEYNNGVPSSWIAYTQDGKVAIEVDGGELNLAETEVVESDHKGYTWIKSVNENNEIWTLTLTNNYIAGNVNLPGKNVIINTKEDSIINGRISSGSGYVLNAIFVGSAPLTINGGISGCTDGDTVTVQDGAKVIVDGTIFLGASGGTNGTLNVIGAGTVLDVSSLWGYAAFCDTVNIKNGASVTVKSQGSSSIGIEALSGVNITGGSTLTAGCDYGVYIIGGKLTMDEDSKLITNASVAPFCIVDNTSSKHQSEVLVLSGIPSGTKIASVKGSDDGYGYNYWSLVPTDGSLSVVNENSTPVTLSGAVSKQLSFVKAEDNTNGNGSSNGGNTSGGNTSGGGSSGGGSSSSGGGSSSSGNTSKTSPSTEKKPNLPKVLVDKLVKEQTKAFSISLDEKTINLDLETLKTIQSQIDADTMVSVEKIDNGTLSVEAKEVIGDRPVYDFTIIGVNGKQVTDFGKGEISVVMPYTLGENEKAENVVAYYIDSTGKVQEVPNSVYDEKNKKLSFKTDHFSKIGIGYKKAKVDSITTAFTDISSHWAKDDIVFVTERGLFGGTDEGKFSPDMSMTRGMFVTVLGRLAKADVSSYKESSFADVKSDAYYMPYIEWASKKDIVSGISVANFAADQAITREQMAVIMANYSKTLGFELPQLQNENIFADNAKISSYAKTAVKQMQMSGLLSGKKDNKFDSKGIATRAEVSAVLKRFVEIAEKK